MREVPEHFRIRIMFIDTVSRDDQADRMPPLPIMRDNTSLFKTRPSRDEIIMDIRQTDYAFDLRPTLMMNPLNRKRIRFPRRLTRSEPFEMWHTIWDHPLFFLSPSYHKRTRVASMLMVVFNIITLALVGYFLFDENITVYEVTGIALGITSIGFLEFGK
jgi:hypothetical protein